MIQGYRVIGIHEYKYTGLQVRIQGYKDPRIQRYNHAKRIHEIQEYPVTRLQNTKCQDTKIQGNKVTWDTKTLK